MRVKRVIGEVVVLVGGLDLSGKSVGGGCEEGSVAVVDGQGKW